MSCSVSASVIATAIAGERRVDGGDLCAVTRHRYRGQAFESRVKNFETLAAPGSTFADLV